VNKSDLILELARRSGLGLEPARRAVDALFGTNSDAGIIAAAIRDGDRIVLAGFGSFAARDRQERVGRNPQTNAPIVIAAGRAPAFRAGSALKAQVRGSGPATCARPEPGIACARALGERPLGKEAP
jgi:DNA-binding protein HU-beta